MVHLATALVNKYFHIVDLRFQVCIEIDSELQYFHYFQLLEK